MGAFLVMTITVETPQSAHRPPIDNGPAAGQWEPNMTTCFTRTIRRAALVLACAASVATFTTSQSFAFSAEAQQMCTGDAFKLCSADIPNIPAITACMIKHRTQLSSGCRVVLDRELAARNKNLAQKDD
jgi:hypothetical protein